jgi:hypothetical protein
MNARPPLHDGYRESCCQIATKGYRPQLMKAVQTRLPGCKSKSGEDALVTCEGRSLLWLRMFDWSVAVNPRPSVGAHTSMWSVSAPSRRSTWPMRLFFLVRGHHTRRCCHLGRVRTGTSVESVCSHKCVCSHRVKLRSTDFIDCRAGAQVGGGAPVGGKCAPPWVCFLLCCGIVALCLCG